MSTRPDGGPAFRGITGGVLHAKDEFGRKDLEFDQADGMSLRDYFAAQALAGITRDGLGGYWGSGIARGYAEHAYMIADAMLAEREK